MFMVIFLWTPPHFWALALVKSEDYSKAKIPMMPNVVGETSTKNQMFIYSVLLFFSSVTPYVLGYSGLLYFVCALSLSFIFITLSLALILIPKKKLEMPLFGYSIFYLFGIFISLVSDKLYYSAY